ncbi:xanthine dehydrogenase family protein molybdopterin-binding subunit [Kibdelosporangium aridum]|uniref:CO or xanthine dehydrogenase, Mo-binding subunit n=1 Tax=Kibdelosporangium aridum TaxID=2030 RepID=A0A1Y5WU66_KIBAR|nr:xanthine dehydrogenase family protein molybdopterin-binding subunit [Kibdelosporangium aridum]SMC47213.1 CO or xanthine dehydrogenase, Mo-binding subunit [Kibdelosporangium aridum]
MADNTAGHVGDRRARFDMRGRVRGALGHVADQPAGPCAHVAVHRSTQPHATIRAVHVEDALAIDGVYAVATGADLYKQFGDRLLTGPAFADQPALAHDKVRYVGEPIAAVLAADLATARAAVDAIYVDYGELDPIYDLETALAGESFVHEELRPSAVFGDLRHLRGVRDTNVNYEYNLRNGDPSAEGAHTVRGQFWAPPTHHVPIELPCTVAWVESGRLEMLTTTQTPSYVRQTISDLLDLPLSQVRVMTRPLGGSFGAKMYDRLEPLAAALAWHFQRKVRIVASREEAFLLTTRHGAAVTASLTADENGELVGANADVAYDTGAYADVGPRITAKSGMVAAGPYKIANATVRSRCVYTNKPSAGPFRGFGVPQVTWSHETLIDELAHELGDDPYRFRLRHLLREGDVAPMGTKMHSADFVGCLDAVAEAIDWDAPLDRGTGRIRRGKGVAVGVKAVLTPTIANAVLQLNQDASATLMISTVDMGQGSDTIMAQIVADVLELDSARVHVVKADTDVTPYDTITAGSRSTYHTGNAVRRVAEAMRAKLTELAGSYDPAGIPELIRGHFGARGATVTTEANYTSTWVPYDKETGRSEKVTEHWFAGAVGVKISVDTATGRVKIDHMAVAGDVGKAINPMLVEQQLTGAAIMGIGHALFDQLVIDQGQLINGTLLDYQLPSIRDLPGRLTPIVVESPHDTGPFGAKGVGETGILGIAPAIGNAVRDALGIRLTTLPMTPESIIAALDEEDR